MTYDSSPNLSQSERYKNLILFLAVLNTIFVVILAALQSDAGIRATLADRDSQYYAVISSSELHRSGLSANYDFMVLTQTLKSQQENLVLMMTALEQQMQGQASQAVISQADAEIALAQAQTGKKFSVLYTDSRFKPQDESGIPDFKQYLASINVRAIELVQKQNEAADAYHLWNQKSDDYAMILTIISIAFLLYSIGQSVVSHRLRLFFAIIGILVQIVCVFWSLIVLIR